MWGERGKSVQFYCPRLWIFMAPFHPRHQSLTNRFRDEDIGIDFGPNYSVLLGTFYKRKLKYDLLVISVV